VPENRRISPRLLAATPVHAFEEPGDYEIYSEPIFRIKVADAEELLTCSAHMIVTTHGIERDASGSRRIFFTVKKWDATGKSKLLNGTIKYELVESLSSFVESGSSVADLPGRMTVAGDFRTSLNDQLVNESHPGKAVGLISRFPPIHGDIFDISGSPIQVGNASVEGLVCACASPN
jgi:hypothetical protein